MVHVSFSYIGLIIRWSATDGIRNAVRYLGSISITIFSDSSTSVPLAEIRRAREWLPPCEGEAARAVYDSLDGWFFDGSWDFKRMCLRGTDMMWTTAFLT